MRNKDDDDYIILGRPFLNTTGAIIYMRSGDIHFQFPKEKVRCYFNSYTNAQQDKKNHSRRRRQHNKKGGEITKSEDTSSKNMKDEEKASPPVKQVWKKKESSPDVQPSGSSSGSVLALKEE